MTTGVVRIKDKQWERITKFAVNCSVQIGKPINQSVVLNAMLTEFTTDVSEKELIEMVKKYLSIE